MRLRIPLLLAALALGALAVPQIASATHVRPQFASPVHNSLVIAQRACTTPGGNTHNPPLAAPSCPPVQASSWLTAGTPDANGAAAGSNSYVRVNPIVGDVQIRSRVTDVRCLPATAPGVCAPANAPAGPDYVGQLQVSFTMRITDHNSNGGANAPGTVFDLPFTLPMGPCLATGPAIGSTCTINTTMGVLTPGGKRTTIEMSSTKVLDGGSSGSAGASDATPYLTSGVFLP